MGYSIIAGNGNKIPPELDAIYRDIVMNDNGHNLNFSYNDQNHTITVNGIAIAYGVVGYFKNVVISNALSNGYVYVDLTTHQDEEIEDEANVLFFASIQTQIDINIANNPGTYRMLVAVLSNGTFTRENVIENPSYATEADFAEIVDGTIASNTRATTAATSNRSTLVATTEFVHNAIEAEITTGTITTVHSEISSYTSNIVKRLGMVGIRFDFSVRGSSVFSDGIPIGETIAVLPIWARPTSGVTKTTPDGRTINIATNGNIVESGSSGGYIGGSSNIIELWYIV